MSTFFKEEKNNRCEFILFSICRPYQNESEYFASFIVKVMTPTPRCRAVTLDARASQRWSVKGAETPAELQFALLR